MVLSCSVVSMNKLGKLDVSLLCFDLNVCPKHVESLTKLINLWPNMQCTHSKLYFSTLIIFCCFVLLSELGLVYACPSGFSYILVDPKCTQLMTLSVFRLCTGLKLPVFGGVITFRIFTPIFGLCSII